MAESKSAALPLGYTPSPAALEVAGDAQRGAPYALHLSRAMVAPHNLRRPIAPAKSAPEAARKSLELHEKAQIWSDEAAIAGRRLVALAGRRARRYKAASLDRRSIPGDTRFTALFVRLWVGAERSAAW